MRLRLNAIIRIRGPPANTKNIKSNSLEGKILAGMQNRVPKQSGIAC